MTPRSLSILAAAVILFGIGATGCAVHRETTLSRTARQRKIQELLVARERLENEREVLLRRTAEVQLEIGAARSESVRVAAQLRATLAALGSELSHLAAAEQDLAAAKQRADEIERELLPLRELEKTLLQQGELRAAAEQRVQLLRQEVAKAEAEADRASADLQPKLEALRQRLQKAIELQTAVTAAQAALEAAAKALLPPAPAPEPGKK